MKALAVSNQRKNIILPSIFFLSLVYCTSFVDLIKISEYHLFEVIFGLSCLATLAYVLMARRILIVKHYITVPFLLIIVWSLVEMMLFDGLKYAPKYFIFALIETWIFINLAVQYVTEENHKSFITYTCWIFMGMAIVLTGFYLSKGIFVNFNDYGNTFTKYVIGFAAICSYYLLFTEGKPAYGVLSYIFVTLSILSTIRKMWIALFVVYVAMTIIYLWGPIRKTIDRKKYKKIFITVLALLMAIIITGALFLTLVPKVNSTVDQTLGDEKTAGDISRQYLNSHAIHRFLESPIIGNGWGDRKIYIPAIDRTNMYHNTYLSILAQLGLIGGVLYFGVFAYSLIKAFIIMFTKPHYFNYGLFIMAIWLFLAVLFNYKPLDRMTYYGWGFPLIFTIVFETWEAKKNLCIGKKN